MFWFGSKTTKERLSGYKTIKVHGMEFVIRKVNPLVDFNSDELPAMFTDYDSRRDLSKMEQTKEQVKKLNDVMKRYLIAGIVRPVLVPIGKGEIKGKEDGITVDDLFRDPTIAMKLFNEIVFHSSNEFRGLSKLFFSIKKKLALLTLYATGMHKDQAITSLKEKT